MVNESSFDQLLGPSDNKNLSKYAIDKGNKNSKIAVENGSNSKNKKQLRQEPIEVNYTHHLKNEGDQ